MPWKYNPFTSKLDRTLSDAEIIALLVDEYLKLDQTIHQHVVNDAPHFDKGLIIKSGEKLIFDGA